MNLVWEFQTGETLRATSEMLRDPGSWQMKIVGEGIGPRTFNSLLDRNVSPELKFLMRRIDW